MSKEQIKIKSAVNRGWALVFALVAMVLIAAAFILGTWRDSAINIIGAAINLYAAYYYSRQKQPPA